MSNPVSLTPESRTLEESSPPILKILPDIPAANGRCSPRIQQKIDMLLLGVESLELGASEYMLLLSKELELGEIIRNRVVLWRLRCTNPWRRTYNRNNLTIDEAKAMVIVAGYMTKRLMVLMRQLIIAEQQMREKGLPIGSHFRISEYLERFRAHFRSRMNPRRAKVAMYLSQDDLLDNISMSILTQLLFSTGTRGLERLWISLFDGEF